MAIDSSEIIGLKEDEWILVMDKVDGFAYSRHPHVAVLWSETQPDAKDRGMQIPIETQINNIMDGMMWAKTERYSGPGSIRVTKFDHALVGAP
jgi:hypothetical protein